jgi:hypothetical protein
MLQLTQMKLRLAVEPADFGMVQKPRVLGKTKRDELSSFLV